MVGSLFGPASSAAAQGPTPVPRPDALIRTQSQTGFGGNDVYNTTGGGQSRVITIRSGGSAHFFVRVHNDADEAGDIRIVGSRETEAFAVRYFIGSRQISPLVKDGTFVFRALAPGAQRTITVEVEPKAASDPGDRRRVVVSARSMTDSTVRDNVVAEARLPRYTSEQRRIAELVNQSRGQAGRRGVALHRQLTKKAQNWAEHMARQGRLSHSNLSAGVPSGWRALAENVGTGGSMASVHGAFMRSTDHRNNLLGPYQYIGTGYAVGFGRVWICQVFMRV